MRCGKDGLRTILFFSPVTVSVKLVSCSEHPPGHSACGELRVGDWLVNLTGFLFSLFSFKHLHHISLPSLGCN